jgi:hypothetical protein
MNWTVKLGTDQQEYKVENTLARRELTMLISEGNVLKVTVQEPDAFSGLHSVEFTSTVFDMYTGKWLEPRRRQLFLTPEQLTKLGAFLSEPC